MEDEDSSDDEEEEEEEEDDGHKGEGSAVGDSQGEGEHTITSPEEQVVDAAANDGGVTNGVSADSGASSSGADGEGVDVNGLREALAAVMQAKEVRARVQLGGVCVCVFGVCLVCVWCVFGVYDWFVFAFVCVASPPRPTCATAVKGS